MWRAFAGTLPRQMCLLQFLKTRICAYGTLVVRLILHRFLLFGSSQRIKSEDCAQRDVAGQFLVHMGYSRCPSSSPTTSPHSHRVVLTVSFRHHKSRLCAQGSVSSTDICFSHQLRQTCSLRHYRTRVCAFLTLQVIFPSFGGDKIKCTIYGVHTYQIT